MKCKLASVAGVTVLTAILAACGGSASSGQTEQADQAAPTAAEPADVADFLRHDDESGGMDCDADDKAKKEIPDCGFYAGPGNTTFYWWSWAKAGRTKPPTGWSAAREVEPYRRPSSTGRGRG